MAGIRHFETNGSLSAEHGFIRVLNGRIFTGDASTNELLKFVSAEHRGKRKYIFTNLKGEKSEIMTLAAYITLCKKKAQRVSETTKDTQVKSTGILEEQ